MYFYAISILSAWSSLLPILFFLFKEFFFVLHLISVNKFCNLCFKQPDFDFSFVLVGIGSVLRIVLPNLKNFRAFTTLKTDIVHFVWNILRKTALWDCIVIFIATDSVWMKQISLLWFHVLCKLEEYTLLIFRRGKSFSFQHNFS